MQHHRHQLRMRSVNSVLASSAGLRWHGCLVQKAFPTLQCMAVSAAAIRLLPGVKPRHSTTTQARLSQLEYLKAIDDYYKNTEKYRRKLRASGIEPLTLAQQEWRYVNWWVKPPLMMDKKLCRTSTIFSFLVGQHPDDVRALHDGTLETKRTCDNDDYWPWYHETISLLVEYSIDHIIPVSQGGRNNRLNYFLMPQTVNNYFADSWTAEKVAYVGVVAALGAGGHDSERLILR